MSYILSALKRVERDRHIGEVPDLSVTDMVEEPQEEESSAVPKFLIGVVLLVVINAGLYIWLKPQSTTSPSIQTPLRALDVPVQDEGQESEITTPSLNDDIAPGSAPETFEVESAREAMPATDERDERMGERAVRSPLPGDGTDVIDYEELPLNVRRDVPEMEISGHIFVPNKPRVSRVIINERVLREGHLVEGNLRVERINARSIIFEMDGHRFQMTTSDLF